jgi:hypothetical protein
MAEFMSDLERDAALSDLKETLLLDDFNLEALSSEEITMFELITLPVVTERQPYDSNVYSPTPGDPYHLVANESNYYHAAEMLMLKRLEEWAMTPGISPEDIDKIEDEIIMQHQLQCKQNHASIERLIESFKNSPASFDLDTAKMINRVRSGEATSFDRVSLLFEHPEMDSIEDMKFTCPFDIKTYKKVVSEYNKDLWSVQLDSEGSIQIENDIESPRPKDVTETADTRVVVMKTVIAEIRSEDTNVVIEVVRRNSFYAFPTIPQLRGITENIFKYKDEKSVNLQPIAVSTYLRVKRDRNKNRSDTAPIEVNIEEKQSIPVFMYEKQWPLDELVKINGESSKETSTQVEELIQRIDKEKNKE